MNASPTMRSYAQCLRQCSRPLSVSSVHQPLYTRAFSTTPACGSMIGSAPLTIPPNVTFNVSPPPEVKSGAAREIGRKERLPVVDVKGPLGELSLPIPNFVRIDFDESSRKARVSILDKTERHQREMWGTTRAYLQNHITGVSEGHNTILRLVGVGYRATVESTATTVSAEFPGQQFVSLKVGYSHPIELPVPKGIKASTPQPTRILLEGCEKEVLKQFAAKIRKWRRPEPYKGKGIFVGDETIKVKSKKIK